jgi:hypothetical protein
MSLHNSIHIIGGGISGLYLALLLSSHNSIKIHVYEKLSFFGGRIQTEYDINQNVLYEKGPWRIHPSHKKIIDLIDKLGLEKKEIRQQIYNDFVKNGKKESDTKFRNQITEYQKCCLEQNIQNANEQMLETGYDMLLQRANGTRAYSYKTFEDTDRFFVLEKGFYSIITCLVNKLKQCKNVFLHTNHHVTDISFNNSIYEITMQIRTEQNFKTKCVKTKCIVFAVPPHVIRDWKSLTLYPNTSMISSLPLIHVYGKLKKEQKWNQNHEKQIVNSPISQIIASTFGNKWFQISYASGRFAMMLQNLALVGKKTFDTYILQEWSKFRKGRANISNIKSYFWRHAVHYWNPNLKSSEKNMMERCIQPHFKKYPNLYWIGEAVSTKQGWMEGAIETSIQVYHDLTSPNSQKKINTKLPKEYVIYDGRILNVEKWKLVHPGSREAIENHLGEDITELWNMYHPKEASKYMVLLEQL